MAFNPQEFAKKYTEVKPTSSFDPTAFASKYTAGTSSKDLTKSSKGLYNLAVENGLQKDADRILEAQKGEQTNSFWSGGVVMDTIDTLNALQHGVTGILKGESFMDGIRNRASFSDKDALGDRGLPGVIAGIVLDIAVDPLTYLAPYTLVKRIPMAEKVINAGKKAIFGEKVVRAVDGGQVIKTAADLKKAGVKTAEDIGVRTFEDIEGGTRLGRLLTEKLAYSYGKDPVFMKIYERGTKNMAITQQSIVGFGKQVAGLSPDVAKQLVKVIDDQGRLGRVALKDLAKKLTPDQLAPVAKLYNYIDNLGKEAVDLGLLSKETYEQNLGEYLKNAYLEFEQKKGAKLPFGYTPTRIKSIFKREEVLSEARKADRIENPAYLLMKSAIDLSRDVENAKLFKQVAQKFGTDVAQPGFTKMAEGKRLGVLSGKYIPDHMAAYLNEIIEPAQDTFGKALIGNFKFAKVVMNPATHVRNVISNMVLNYWKLGMNPLDPRTIKAQKEAIKEIAIAARKSGVVDDVVLDPVMAEAKKYKSAEEFVKAQGQSVFRGGDTDIDISRGGGRGISVSDKETAGLFTPPKGGVVDEAILPKTAKILKEVDIPKNLQDTYIKEAKVLADPNNFSSTLQKSVIEKQQAIVEYARKNGFDAVEFPFEKEIRIIKPNVLKTKSQLTDLWKKANEGGKTTSKTPWIDEATPLGYNLDTFASAELKGILESPEMTTAMGKAGSGWQKAKKKLGDIYQGEENFAKLTAYIYQREVKKMNPEEAWKAAESATFNYAQVTPFIRKVRTSIWGMPFITFSYKATPLAIETALKNPGRISVIGKIKNGIEEQSDLERTDRERASEPPWVKDGFYIKLPGEDKYGRSMYFDLTYILPFGDLVSGSLFERGIKSDTGTPESPAEATLRKNPVTQLIMELGKNRNFYGNKIWRDSDPAEVQTRDIFLHIAKTYAPPLLGEQLPNGYNARNGEREWKGIPGGIGATDENQQRTLIQELLRNAGIKIQPMSAEIQETYQEWNKKKALETLLKESGVLKGMEINYVPKEND